VWAGRSAPDPRRSAKLADFVPLTALRDAVFVSLQKGEGVEQAAHPPAGMTLLD
jgi:hypothetical protein